MAVEVIGAARVQRRFQTLLATFGKQLMGEVGMFVMTRIKERTAKGVDVGGSSFKPYSAQYAFFRESKGRPTDKVDLFFTGSMMSAMTPDASESRVRVFFLPTQDRSGSSNPAKAFYLNQKREFFALSPQDKREIGTLVLDEFRKAMQT